MAKKKKTWKPRKMTSPKDKYELDKYMKEVGLRHAVKELSGRIHDSKEEDRETEEGWEEYFESQGWAKYMEEQEGYLSVYGCPICHQIIEDKETDDMRTERILAFLKRSLDQLDELKKEKEERRLDDQWKEWEDQAKEEEAEKKMK